MNIYVLDFLLIDEIEEVVILLTLEHCHGFMAIELRFIVIDVVLAIGMIILDERPMVVL